MESCQIGSFFYFFSRRNCMVTINGSKLDIAGQTLLWYLAGSNYGQDQIAVERNGKIIPKSQYAEAILADGDVVEIVRFVGGG